MDNTSRSNVLAAEEDVVSLFGGWEFESQDDIFLENEALLTSIDDAFVASLEKGPPPMSRQLASIIDGKFTAEFDLLKRKEIADKYPVPENCASLFKPKVNPEM